MFLHVFLFVLLGPLRGLIIVLWWCTGSRITSILEPLHHHGTMLCPLKGSNRTNRKPWWRNKNLQLIYMIYSDFIMFINKSCMLVSCTPLPKNRYRKDGKLKLCTMFVSHIRFQKIYNTHGDVNNFWWRHHFSFESWQKMLKIMC